MGFYSAQGGCAETTLAITMTSGRRREHRPDLITQKRGYQGTQAAPRAVEPSDGDTIIGELVDDLEGPDMVYIGTPVEPKNAAIALASLSIAAMFVVLILQSFVFDSVEDSGSEGSNDRSIEISWGESQYLPRHPECVDESNGQDLPEYGIGYEPSISITSSGNMFVTAHKDLRWGGESNPFFPLLGGDPGPWYACEQGQQTSWDYWASWFWAS